MSDEINQLSKGIRVTAGVFSLILLVVTIPIFINLKTAVSDAEALKKLDTQIGHLSEQISTLAKVTDESNTLQRKVDELKEAIVIMALHLIEWVTYHRTA
uniref:Uncharacterized protein n=1 Tax=Candidatus Kentrum sp. TC TaxID=2126339 RepID=A0A450ZEZ3_9GAMM|nr:MAG: hypothetical protein BECKTC1821D_GA0114238_11716 [Candidatus Kentron sp. TC]